MDLSVLATLVSLTMLSLSIGVLTSVLLLWAAPNNALFEVLEMVRDAVLVGDEEPEAPVQKKAVAPPKLESEPPPVPEEATEPPQAVQREAATQIANPALQPVAANSDSPRPSESVTFSDPVEDEEASEADLDAMLDSMSYDQLAEGKMENDRREKDFENLPAAAAEETSAHLDAGKKEDLEPQNTAKTPSSFEGESNQATASEAAEAEDSPEHPALVALEGANSVPYAEEIESLTEEDAHIVSSEPVASEEKAELGASKNEEAWTAESSNPPEESSRVELNAAPKPDDAQEAQDLGELNPENPELVPSEAPLPGSKQWAAVSRPQVSSKEALVSERSTMALGSWEASDFTEEYENEEVQGSGEQVFDDRKVVRGDGSHQFRSSGVNDLVDKKSPRIRSNWELKSEKERPSSGDYAFGPSAGKGEVSVDNRHDVNEPDVGFRGDVIRPKEVTIERDDDSMTDQLRLEALRNEDLRGVLLSIKNADTDQSSTEIIDMSTERGDGHERHTIRYSSGALRTQTDTFNGAQHGSFHAWYENGQAMVEGRYEHGAASGVWTLWDAEGRQLICAEINKVLNQWDYKAKVRYIETSKPKPATG